jgi:hypothetical protein
LKFEKQNSDGVQFEITGGNCYFESLKGCIGFSKGNRGPPLCFFYMSWLKDPPYCITASSSETKILTPSILSENTLLYFHLDLLYLWPENGRMIV